MTTIQLNGVETTTAATSLIELINELNQDPEKIIVEKNGTLFKKEALLQQAVKNGDIIEILHFMGGGTL